MALLSTLGLVLPVAVALGAYAVSARSFDSEAPLVSVERLARPKTPPASPTPTARPTAGDDQGGRCSEPEHRDDPECLNGEDRSGSGDSSGSGSGDSGSESDNSGKGSSGSGDSDDDD